ncbi:CRISPR-associated protein Csx18 [Anthocerotibacter panamensis]|uniref:CRISPR-associated protein Csx18 n=1 Tax=Anthocerotibacter panamensis TaxID=2857077 RepID=UPI001C40303C|nr:CRISPR-associated protein Csx18 [Anthocerotibacter panamensis]
MNTQRLYLVRTGSVAFFNGLVTLVILLIAPLGLAAVITCTLAVTLSSLGVGFVADRITRGLLDTPVELLAARGGDERD